MSEAFNARAIFAWRPDRLYRVYWTSGQLHFIRIGGQSLGGARALEQQLGLLGRFLAKPLRRRAHRKLRRAIAEADSVGPEVRVREHKHNLRIAPQEVLESEVLPPGVFASHGIRVGRWTLSLRGRPRLVFQFETLEDMHAALQQLPQYLGERLHVRAVWDEARGAYRKVAPPAAEPS